MKKRNWILLALFPTLVGAQPLKVQADNGHEQRWAANSVLAQGQWVRIIVTDDGIYHLTNSQLTEMGFNPANIRVYGYGGHRQSELLDPDNDWDDLEPVSLQPTTDGYLFHADGLVHWKDDSHVVNHYARAASYFVTETDSPVPDFPVEAATASAADGPTTTFTAYAVHDPQEFAFFQGGSKLFDATLLNGNSLDYSLTLPAPPAHGNGLLRVSFAATNLRPMELTTSFNGIAFPAKTFSEYPDDYSYAVVRCDEFSVTNVEESCVVRLTAETGRRGRLDYLELVYTGVVRLTSDRPYIQFTHAANDIRIEFADGQQPQLWRLAEPGQPATRLKGNIVTTSDGRQLLCATTNDNQEHRYVAFDAAATYAPPTIAGPIANQNLHATEALDMVIITPASGIFDEQAERLADVHRQWDGMRVGVVRADQIYNEFSSGTPDATAYRRFLKMLYDRAGEDRNARPRYLLLFGDGAWDNRMYSNSWKNYSPDDFLLCYESDNSTHDILCYVAEDYFALLDDGEGGNIAAKVPDMPDVGVGRFPVRTIEQATALVDKTIRHIRLEHAGPWRNLVCFMGDDGDDNQHQSMANDVAEQLVLLRPELEIKKVYWDAYQRESTTSGFRYPQVQQIVKAQMEEGALMMNYTGHGHTYTISQERVLEPKDFAAFSSPCTPLWVTAACDIQPFDGQKENIGETAILNPNGGAVAFYGTTRTVYATSNARTNRVFCEALFGKDANGRPNRVGDAVRISKQATDLAHCENRLHFVLLGDPALCFGGNGYRVVLDQIDGTPVAELGSDFKLNAGGKAQLAGHIENALGQLQEDFDGTVALHLFDSKSNITCLNNDNTAHVQFTFSTFDKKLFEMQGYVQGGHFAFTCPIPLDINYSDEIGRMTFYALSNDSTLEATGYSEDFRLGGTASDLDDFDGPEITAYLDREDFTSGEAVGPQPTFVARLFDENGICTSANGLGHNLELILDNNSATTFNLNAFYRANIGDYTRGTVIYELPKLEEGEHRLRFRAWDLLNNYASIVLNFNIDATIENGIEDVESDASGLRNNERQAVYDLAGRRVGSSSTLQRSSMKPGIYIVGGKKVIIR